MVYSAKDIRRAMRNVMLNHDMFSEFHSGHKEDDPYNTKQQYIAMAFKEFQTELETIEFSKKYRVNKK